jgi:hypothetical protein
MNLKTSGRELPAITIPTKSAEPLSIWLSISLCHTQLGVMPIHPDKGLVANVSIVYAQPIVLKGIGLYFVKEGLGLLSLVHLIVCFLPEYIAGEQHYQDCQEDKEDD